MDCISGSFPDALEKMALSMIEIMGATKAEDAVAERTSTMSSLANDVSFFRLICAIKIIKMSIYLV